MDDLWYADGLAFECTQCGNCCTGFPGFVWITEDEIDRLAEHLGEPREQVVGLYTRRERHRRSLKEKANNDCIFFDRKVGCTVYEVRPMQCRTWPFWESTARTPESWSATARNCPGCNRGPVISAEEITRRIRSTRI